MPAATVPEIQRTSMLTAVLYLKSLPLDVDVLAFDFLDPPSVSSCSIQTGFRQSFCTATSAMTHVRIGTYPRINMIAGKHETLAHPSLTMAGE